MRKIFYSRVVSNNPGYRIHSETQEAFRIVHKAVHKMKKVGIGQITMHNREYLVALKVYQKGFLLNHGKTWNGQRSRFILGRDCTNQPFYSSTDRRGNRVNTMAQWHASPDERGIGAGVPVVEKNWILVYNCCIVFHGNLYGFLVNVSLSL